MEQGTSDHKSLNSRSIALLCIVAITVVLGGLLIFFGMLKQSAAQLPLPKQSTSDLPVGAKSTISVGQTISVAGVAEAALDSIDGAQQVAHVTVSICPRTDCSNPISSLTLTLKKNRPQKISNTYYINLVTLSDGNATIEIYKPPSSDCRTPAPSCPFLQGRDCYSGQWGPCVGL